MEENAIIKKWLNDELSPAEKKVFDSSEDAPFFEAILAGAKQFVPPVNVMPAFNEFDKRHLGENKSKSSLKSLVRWISGVAAIVVLAFGIYNWSGASTTQIATTIAETKNVTLPDDSEVTLNAQSSISYNAQSWDYKRLVVLEGEAFFDVAKGARFDVETSEGTISVLGTEFNVRQRGAFFEVVCYEGKVQVTSASDSVILLPGEAISFINGMKSTETVIEQSPSWKDGMSSFKNVPLSEVLAEVPRYFDVVILADNINIAQRVNVTFEHSDIDTALKAITDPLDLSYHINGNQVTFKPREE